MGNVSMRTDPGFVLLTFWGAVCEEGHQQRHVVYVLQVGSHLVDPSWKFGLKKKTKRRLSRSVCVREAVSKELLKLEFPDCNFKIRYKLMPLQTKPGFPKPF